MDPGGIEIEENWDRVKTVTVPTAGEADGDVLAPLLGSLPLELRPAIERFIQAAFMVCTANKACASFCSFYIYIYINFCSFSLEKRKRNTIFFYAMCVKWIPRCCHCPTRAIGGC